MTAKKTTTRKSTKAKATAKTPPAKKKATPKRRTTASKAKAKAAPKKAPAAAPKPGTTLTRKFKNKVYELKVTADGYALGDMKFRTLTAAAKAVTSYPSVSGPRFWLGTGTEKGAK